MLSNSIRRTISNNVAQKIGPVKDFALNNHGVFITTAGELWTVGRGFTGTLGDGDIENKTQIQKIPGMTNCKSCAVTLDNSYVIKNDGSLWVTGSNVYGQCGNTSTGFEYKLVTTQFSTATTAKLVLGIYNTLVLKTDGTLWINGYNNLGQIGDDSLNNSKEFYQVPGYWSEADTSYYSSYGIKSDGTLWAWGSNVYGQLGLDPTQVYYTTPTQVGSDTNWIKVYVGQFYVLAVKSNGTLWGCGINDSYQLGLGDIDTRYTFTQIGTDTDWNTTQISTYNSTMARKANGNLWGWGADTARMLGDGVTTTKMVPTLVSSATDWVSVSAGNNASYGIKSNGTLWGVGTNTTGQLGIGTLSNKNSWTQIGTDTNWAAVSGGANTMAARKTDGTIWGCGSNIYGMISADGTVDRVATLTQIGTYTDVSHFECSHTGLVFLRSSNNNLLGNGYTIYYTFGQNTCGSMSFIQIGTDTNWASVSGGNYHAAAIKTDGTLWVWGRNNYHQLGNGTIVDVFVPTQVGTNTNWKSVVCTNVATMALTTDGTLFSWGYNGVGQLGLNSLTDQYTPAQVGTDTDWYSISGAGATSGGYFALKTNKTIWLSGPNAQNPQGSNSSVFYYTPTLMGTVSLYNNAETAFSAFTQVLNIRSNGQLYGWGNNTNGQLGLGTENDVNTGQILISGMASCKYVHTAQGLSLVIKQDGTLWAAGLNTYYQTGKTTDTNDQTTFIQIGTDTWKMAQGGIDCAMGIKSDGTLWGWGRSNLGQLGTGTATRTAPYQVLTTVPSSIATDWESVQIGYGNHVLGRRQDGSLWGWGYNNNGQLGLGDNNNKTMPYLIGDGTDTWIDYSVGNNFSLGIKTNGTLWGWGVNSSGQLGLGDTVLRAIPAQVGTNTNWVRCWCARTSNTSFAQNSLGEIYTFGQNTNGNMGTSSGVTYYYVPTLLNTSKLNFKYLFPSVSLTFLVDTLSSMYVTGLNHFGQYGNSTQGGASPNGANFLTFTQVSAETDWAMVAGSVSVMIASKNYVDNGSLHNLHITGTPTKREDGRSGNDHPLNITQSSYLYPSLSITGLPKKLLIGNNNVGLITSNDQCYLWGYNGYGQLGNNDVVDIETPYNISS